MSMFKGYSILSLTEVYVFLCYCCVGVKASISFLHFLNISGINIFGTLYFSFTLFCSVLSVYKR